MSDHHYCELKQGVRKTCKETNDPELDPSEACKFHPDRPKGKRCLTRKKKSKNEKKSKKKQTVLKKKIDNSGSNNADAITRIDIRLLKCPSAEVIQKYRNHKHSVQTHDIKSLHASMLKADDYVTGNFWMNSEIQNLRNVVRSSMRVSPQPPSPKPKRRVPVFPEALSAAKSSPVESAINSLSPVRRPLKVHKQYSYNIYDHFKVKNKPDSLYPSRKHLKLPELDAIQYFDEKKRPVDHKKDEREEQYVATDFIHPDSTVLELGARYGVVSSVINHKLQKPQNHVVVEPDKSVLDALKQNKKSHFAHFHIMNGVVSNKKLGLKKDGYATKAIPVKNKKDVVKSLKIKHLESKFNLTFDTLVADCEGCLCDFVEENIEFVAKQLKYVMYEADVAENCDYEEKVEKVLRNAGFKRDIHGFVSFWSKRSGVDNSKTNLHQKTPPKKPVSPPKKPVSPPKKPVSPPKKPESPPKKPVSPPKKPESPPKKGPKKKTVAINELPDYDENYYDIINVPDDGNCGYHAFIEAMKMSSYNLKQGQVERNTPDALRKYLAGVLSKQKKNYTSDSNEMRTINEAIDRISGGIGIDGFIPDEFWIADKEFNMLADKFKVCIHIWEEAAVGQGMWTFSGTEPLVNADECLRKKKNILLIHTNGGTHFQVLKKK